MTTATTDVVEQMKLLQADLTVFYRKLRHYHWSVTGAQFFELHTKFEEIYTQWGEFIDAIAERLVGLDVTPTPTYQQDLELSRIEEDSETPDATTMVSRLIADLETQAANVKQATGVAEDADDRRTENLLDGITDAIADHRWMLKSFLGN